MVKPSKCSFTNFLVSVYLVSGGRVLVLLDTGESSLSPPCAHKQKHSSTYKRGWLAALNVECLVLKWLDRYRGVNCQFQFVLLKSAGAAFQRENTWYWQWQSGIGFVRREESESSDPRRTLDAYMSVHVRTHKRCSCVIAAQMVSHQNYGDC